MKVGKLKKKDAILNKDIDILPLILVTPSPDVNFSGTATPPSLSPANTTLVHSSVRTAGNLRTWTAGVDKRG